MSSRSLQDVFEDVFETSSRYVYKTSSSRLLQEDVLQTCLGRQKKCYAEDVLTNIQHLFTETNVCWVLTWSSHRRYSVKKRHSFKFCNIHNNTIVLESLFKKRLQCNCFPVNIAKFLRAPILKNASKQVLLTSVPKDRLLHVWLQKRLLRRNGTVTQCKLDELTLNDPILDKKKKITLN